MRKESEDGTKQVFKEITANIFPKLLKNINLA